MFISTRELGNEYQAWNEDSIKDRSKKLANWAIVRWSKET